MTVEQGFMPFMAWNYAYRYGNIPLARQAVEALQAAGWPTEGMLEMVEENWEGVEAAQTGWALRMDGTPA